jgi:hypothetical protein
MTYSKEKLKELYSHLSEMTLNTIWRKAFKREIWDCKEIDNKYKNVTIMEDLYLTLRLFEKAEVISYIPEHLYYYRCNLKSISHVFKENRIFDKLLVFQFLKSFLYGQGLYEENYKSINSHIINAVKQYISSMADKSCGLSRTEKYQLFEKIRDNEQFTEAIKDNAKISYVVGALYDSDFETVEKYIKSQKLYRNMRYGLASLILR